MRKTINKSTWPIKYVFIFSKGHFLLQCSVIVSKKASSQNFILHFFHLINKYIFGGYIRPSCCGCVPAWYVVSHHIYRHTIEAKREPWSIWNFELIMMNNLFIEFFVFFFTMCGKVRLTYVRLFVYFYNLITSIGRQ